MANQMHKGIRPVLQAKDLPDLEAILAARTVSAVTIFLSFADVERIARRIGRDTVSALAAVGDRYGKTVSVNYLID